MPAYTFKASWCFLQSQWSIKKSTICHIKTLLNPFVYPCNVADLTALQSPYTWVLCRKRNSYILHAHFKKVRHAWQVTSSGRSSWSHTTAPTMSSRLDSLRLTVHSLHPLPNCGTSLALLTHHLDVQSLLGTKCGPAHKFNK